MLILFVQVTQLRSELEELQHEYAQLLTELELLDNIKEKNNVMISFQCFSST